MNMNRVQARQILATAEAFNLDAESADQLMVRAGVPKRHIASARSEMLKAKAREAASKMGGGRWQ